ncbi:Mitochondrial ATPase complex subunit ATP10 [Vanrija pseudolonga]|uniref:Mitochondrial ATPase complex subunit ATP10 n=1 Tax=Vanrija pseudolonga TaxID=143232 RepID=A0AAF1BRV5_9TREE|nr:Mitochondrial ATPase complex subunit ATP10 [Vanrija pseudolonga]
MSRHLRTTARAAAATRPAVQPRLAASARFASSSSSSQPEASSSSSKAAAPSPPAAEVAKGKAPAAPKGKPPATDPYAVPPLSRPLGTPIPPSSDPQTRAQRLDQMLDQTRRKEERKALVKEATQGYFHDYHLARKANGGKLWVAPPVLIREDRALYFPDISGKALTGGTVHTTDLFRGRVSLVSIVNTRVSEEHVQSFVEPVLEDWAGQPGFNYVQINHQPNALKGLLISLFVSSLKRTIPEDRWGSYLISSGEWSEFDVSRPLGIENKLLGYVYLVDENAKVRWAGCAQATPKETEDLRRAAAVLVRRHAGESGAGAAAPKTE